MRIRPGLLAFLVLSAPLSAFATSTTTLVAPFDHTIQGDATAVLRMHVCNTGGASIDQLRLRFGGGNNNYDFSENQVNYEPTGWTATWGANDTRFDANTAGDRIAVGFCRDFDILLEGDGGGIIASGAVDQTDRFNIVDVRHNGGVIDNPIPTWKRHGLALLLSPNVTSAPVGGSVVLTYYIENRSTATQNNIGSLPAAPATVPPGAVSGPAGTTPASLSLVSGAAGSFTYTATTLAAGYFQFSAIVQQAGGATTSPATLSSEIAVGAFTSQIAVVPDTSISGQSFDVVMTVQNNGFSGPSALGNVVPTRDPLTRDPIKDPDSIGTAVPGVVKVSGPFPASIPSLAKGNSGQFRWTYTVTGALSQTYKFRGGAIANGMATAMATSNTGTITPFTIRVTPNIIARGEVGPLLFQLGNGTASSSTQHIRITFQAGWILDATTPVIPPAGYNCTRDSNVRVTCNVTSGQWDPGEVLPFQIFLAANGVPIPAGTADDPYPVEVHFHLPTAVSSQKPNVDVLAAAYRINLASVPAPPQPADGNTAMTLTATVTRVSTGLPLAGATVNFSTTAGSLSAETAITNAAGQASVVLTAPTSSVAINGTASAKYLSHIDSLPLSFTGFVGGNLLYVGGSLFPRQVAPGGNAAFSIMVQNVGTASVTVPTVVGDTTFSAKDGVPAHDYTSILIGSQTIPAGATATLNFTTVAFNPAFALGAYFPTFSYNPTRSISDPVTVVAGSPTFASVLGPDAEPAGGGARVSWSTELELENTGFRVLRSDEAGEPEEIGWVPATGASFSDYEFLDAPLTDGAHAYWIEDVAMDGTATRHGPVALFLGAGPGAGNGGDSASTVGVAPATARAAGDDPRWADPAALGGVRIVDRDETGITFEIIPPPYEVQSIAWPVQVHDRIRIPGWGSTEDDGYPDLPARSIPVAIPGNATGRLTVRALEETTVTGLSPTWYLGADTAEGFSGLAGDPPKRKAPRTSDSALYPARAVSFVERGRMGDRPVGSLVVTPLRFDPVDGLLHSATRILAHVDFLPAAPLPAAIVSPQEATQDRILSAASLKLEAPLEGGLVRVPLAELVAAGVDLSLAQVYRRGAAVPSRVEGPELVFLAQATRTPWTATQAFWIAARASGEAARVIPGVAGSAPVPAAAADTAVRTKHFEQDASYGFLAGQGLGDDRWYWAEVLTSGPLSQTVGFDIPGAAPTGPASLSVTLQGMYDDVAAPNFHVARLLLNGTDLGTATIADDQRASTTLAVPAGVLVAGANSLEILCESTTPSHIGLDAVDVSWSAFADAAGAAALVLDAASSGVLTAGGFAEAPILAVDETDPSAPSLLPFGTVTDDGLVWRVAVDVAQGRRVRFVTASDAGSSWSSRAGRAGILDGEGADYVVLAASDLIAPAAEWAGWRATGAGGGFRTRTFDIADLYDAMSFGDPDPSATQRFLERAHGAWPQPSARYLLLVGDSTFDPLDHLGLGAQPGLLLAPHVATEQLIAVSDVRSATLGANDFLPDLSVGRIPARTPAEVLSVLAKTEAYETAARDGWNEREVLLSDDDLLEFDAASADAAAYLPVGMAADLVSASSVGDAAAELALTDSLGNGQALVTYVGHGGIQTWGSEGYLDVAGVPGLPSGHTPVMLAVDCLNAYFDFPGNEGLGETLVRADGAGAAAVWASTAITHSGGHRDLALAFHDAFWRKPLLRLGDVTSDAISGVAWRADAPDLVSTFVLLGDPALRLNVNRPPVALATLESIVDDHTATLSAAASTDVDGDALSFRWELVSAPQGATATIEPDVNAPDHATLTGSSLGRYRVRLLAADAFLAGPSDELDVELTAHGTGGNDSGGGLFGCSVGTLHGNFLGALLALAAGMFFVRRRR